MRHAGVGITITSITDIAVFGIGGTTVSIFFSFLKTVTQPLKGPPLPALLLPVHHGGHRLHVRLADDFLRGVAGRGPGQDRRAQGRRVLLGEARRGVEAQQAKPEELPAGGLREGGEGHGQAGHEGRECRT